MFSLFKIGEDMIGCVVRVNPLTKLSEWFNARTKVWYPNLYRMEVIDVKTFFRR